MKEEPIELMFDFLIEKIDKMLLCHLETDDKVTISNFLTFKGLVRRAYIYAKAQRDEVGELK